jgi:Ca2+-binding EF-hand superfamily protein
VDTWTPRGLAPAPREREPSPTRGANASPGFGGMLANVRNTRDNNALLKLQPAQVRELREGFQILDRDGDGHVGRDDVADMLTQLGQCLYSQAIPYLQFPGMAANPSDITPFFPPSTPQNITLPAYLNSLASLLAVLSPPPELLSAFSAFDEDDSGQVDLAELRDALLHTSPDPGEKPLTERDIDRVMNGFTGRRAFGKHTAGSVAQRGEVFKYQDFVAGVAGGASVEGKENGEEN